MSNIMILDRQIIPSASRMMKSLRSLGYDFSQAVADLVDNSIEADATTIAIDVEFDGENSRLRIADDGVGMPLAQLQEAMRFGSEKLYDYEEGLGKFGLGLKTASLSQCQRLSVASWVSSNTVHSYCWDINHVEKTNKWELIIPNQKDIQRILGERSFGKTGTAILWQHLDKMFRFKDPYGRPAQNELNNASRDLEQHLAMVFHRYLAGEVPGKKLRILLNGNPIEPWDPFARGEPKTQELKPISVRVEYEGVAGTVILQPYILPHETEFSSPDAWRKATGPAKWNQQQGFYVYRANRLIQSGGWSGLRTLDEHTKLARISLNFSPHLDDAFGINVAKMKVQIPSQIKERIEKTIKPIAKQAEDVYRKGRQKQGASSVPPTPKSTSSYTSTSVPETQPIPKKLWTLDEIQSRLDKIASADEKATIAKVFSRLRKELNQ